MLSAKSCDILWYSKTRRGGATCPSTFSVNRTPNIPFRQRLFICKKFFPFKERILLLLELEKRLFRRCWTLCFNFQISNQNPFLIINCRPPLSISTVFLTAFRVIKKAVSSVLIILLQFPNIESRSFSDD